MNTMALYNAWSARSEELADWVFRHLLVRADRHGGYYRKPGEKAKPTTRDALTRDDLVRHFRATRAEHLVGLHSTVWLPPATPGGTTCWARWLALDIDNHDDRPTDPAATLRAALAFRARLVGLGFDPLLLSSNGKGGYHVWIVLDRPAPSPILHAFGQWLVRDWEDYGLAAVKGGKKCGKPETFPKQPTILPDGCGNWLRLPGLHHSREHWSEAHDECTGRWLAGHAAIDKILATRPSPPSLIPAEARATAAARVRADALALLRPKSMPRGLSGEALRARDALEHLEPIGMHRDEWRDVGMALHELDDEGFGLWVAWSSRDMARFDEDVCRRQWGSFKPATLSRHISLATLFHKAKESGYSRRRDDDRDAPDVIPVGHPTARPPGYVDPDNA